LPARSTTTAVIILVMLAIGRFVVVATPQSFWPGWTAGSVAVSPQ
jgi:hypothetical protein